MNIKSSLIILILVLLSSCTSVPVKDIPSTTAIPTHPITTLPTTGTNDQNSEYRVDEFSEDYYGIVHIDSLNGFDKTGWIAIYDKALNNEYIKVTFDRISFTLHEGKVIANILEWPYGEESLIFYGDFNFDKEMDFAIQDGSSSCYGNPSFKVFLFQNKEFVLSEDFTRLAHEYCGMFKVDNDAQKIYTMQKSGCCWHQYSEFAVERNIPVVKKITETEWSMPFMNTTIKEWNDGKIFEKEEQLLLREKIRGFLIFSFDLQNEGDKVSLFSIDGEILNYAITTNDGKVKYYFPAKNMLDERAFLFLDAGQSEVILQFTDNNTSYMIYENINDQIVEKIGIQITEDGQMVNLEGIITTIQGNLLDIKKKNFKNVYFDK